MNLRQQGEDNRYLKFRRPRRMSRQSKRLSKNALSLFSRNDSLPNKKKQNDDSKPLKPLHLQGFPMQRWLAFDFLRRSPHRRFSRVRLKRPVRFDQPYIASFLRLLPLWRSTRSDIRIVSLGHEEAGKPPNAQFALHSSSSPFGKAVRFLVLSMHGL
jgi:hypothetical protein